MRPFFVGLKCRTVKYRNAYISSGLILNEKLTILLVYLYALCKVRRKVI